MPPLPLRIAILECDTPNDNVRAKHGTYGDVFSSLLRKAAKSLFETSPPEATLALSAFDVVTAQEYPKLEDVDGILISGSKYNSFDNDEWILKLVQFTKEVLAQRRVRLFGVCFGHQIIGRALDVKVDRSDKGWELSVVAIDLTKKGQEIFGRPSLALHQMHRDIVYEYPEGVEALAYTDKCSVQGMYAAKRFITVQGHPEFSEDIMKEILTLRHTQGIFDDSTFEEAMSRNDKYHDGVLVAQAFLKLVMED